MRSGRPKVGPFKEGSVFFRRILPSPPPPPPDPSVLISWVRQQKQPFVVVFFFSKMKMFFFVLWSPSSFFFERLAIFSPALHPKIEDCSLPCFHTPLTRKEFDPARCLRKEQIKEQQKRARAVDGIGAFLHAGANPPSNSLSFQMLCLSIFTFFFQFSGCDQEWGGSPRVPGLYHAEPWRGGEWQGGGVGGDCQ